MKKYRVPLSLLCVLFLIFSVSVSFADSVSYKTADEALQAGQQLDSIYGIQWHSPSLFDDQSNEAFASFLSSVSFETSQTRDENGNGCFKGSLNLGEYCVADYQILSQDGSYYIQILGTDPFILPFDEMEGFVMNLRSYLISMGVFTEEDLAEMEEELVSIYSQLSAEIENLQKTIPSSIEIPDSFAEIGSIFSSWAESAFAGETISESAVSFNGDQSVERVEYALTTDEIVSLLHALGKAGLENEAFSSDLLSFLKEIQLSLSFEGAEVLTMEDLNEVYNGLLTVSAEDFPENFTACFAMHMTQSSSHAYTTLELSAAENDVLLSFNMEISYNNTRPAMKLYFTFDDGYDPAAFDLTIVHNPEKTLNEETGTITSSSSEITLNITINGTVYPFTFSLNNSLTEGQTVSSKDISAILSMDLAGSHFELYAVYNNLISYIFGYNASHEISFGLSADEMMLPLFSLNKASRSTNPEGCSFSAADAVHPGTMTQAEFNSWMNSIVFEVAERVFSVPAYLPEELRFMTDSDDYEILYDSSEEDDEYEAAADDSAWTDVDSSSSLPENAEVFLFSEDIQSSSEEISDEVPEETEAPKKNVFKGLHN